MYALPILTPRAPSSRRAALPARAHSMHGRSRALRAQLPCRSRLTRHGMQAGTYVLLQRLHVLGHRMMLRRMLECQLEEGGSGTQVSLRTVQAVLERCGQHYTIEEARPHTPPPLASQPLLLPMFHAHHALHGHPATVLAA